MSILLIEDDLSQKNRVATIVKSATQEEIVHASTLQYGIELLESSENEFSLIVCDYHGKSTSLIQCLLALKPNIPSILVSELLRDSLEKDLTKLITDLHGKVSPEYEKRPDSEFVRMNLTIFKLLQPLEANIYLRLGELKYLKIFKKDDTFSEEDLLRYLNKTKSEFFYVRHSEANRALDKQNEKIANLLKARTLNTEQTRTEVSTYIEIMQEVITKTGFTPQVQEMAKKTVNLTLKVLGNNPKLSSILKRMKREGSLYIPSHSLALAEIACSLACKVEWHSSSTFLKLSLAAFLHDLPVSNDKLAQVQTLKELNALKDLSAQEIQDYRQHPLKAADFAKQFREIPSDVDTIIAQHHERPDGSGFPRGLHHNQIQPLSALFIISHDLLVFLLERKEAKLRDFVTSRSGFYSSGIFGKLFRTIQVEFLNKRTSST